MRGTFAGLSSPAVIEHLWPRRHGGRAAAGARLRRRPRTWSRSGCATTGATIRSAYLCARSAASRTAISASSRRWSSACTTPGIEVILDVVYNHTAEGNQLGPTLSFRGIDNESYYRLGRRRALLRRRHRLRQHARPRHPRVLQMVTDSLRYWVERDARRRVPLRPRDGARARRQRTVRTAQRLLRGAPARSGALARQADRRAVGSRPGGYQLGDFPPGWSEWNDRYRDTVRRFWRGDDGSIPDLASRLTGSSDLFDQHGPPPARERQLHHRARRLHAARSRLLQPQTQRGEPRRQPRRHRRQLQLELRRGRADRAIPRSSRCASSKSATSSRRCSSRRALPMLLGGRRVRAHAARQQQRVLPGQRDRVDRLDACVHEDADLLVFVRSLNRAAPRASRLSPSAFLPRCRNRRFRPQRHHVVRAQRARDGRSRLARSVATVLRRPFRRATPAINSSACKAIPSSTTLFLMFSMGTSTTSPSRSQRCRPDRMAARPRYRASGAVFGPDARLSAARSFRCAHGRFRCL